MRRQRSRCRRGVTLLEMLLAISLIVLMMGFMFQFYWNVLRTRERGTSAIESTQLGRVVAERMAREIRAAGNDLSLGVGIEGTERVLKLNTILLPDLSLFRPRSITDRPLAAQCDMRQIQYYLAYDEEEQAEYPDGDVASRNLGLVRREIRTLHQPSTLSTNLDEIDTDLLGPELGYLRFRYFDGVDWVRRWQLRGQQGQNPLPLAVEVTVGYDRLPPEDPEEIDFEEQDASEIAEPEPYSPGRFTVVVPLAEADRVFFSARLMRAQTQMQSSGGLGAGGVGGGGLEIGGGR